MHRRLGWLLWTITLGQVALALALAFLNGFSLTRLFAEYVVSQALGAIAFASVGALIVERRRRNPIGWLYCALGLGFGWACWLSQYAHYSLVTAPGTVPAAQLAGWLNLWSGVPVLLTVVLVLPLVYPSGRLPSPQWRPLLWLSIIAIALFSASWALSPGPVDSSQPDVPNAFAPPNALEILSVLAPIANLMTLAALVGAACAVAARYRSADELERQQLAWFGYGASILLASLLIPIVLGILVFHTFPGDTLLSGVLVSVGVPAVPVATGIAILRHRLYEIDRLINRTLVYGALTSCIVVFYGLAVGYLSSFFVTADNLLISLVATGLVAILFQPLRDRLQRGVDRLLYGDRDAPYRALVRLGERLQATLAPDEVFVSIVSTVRDALKAPFAALELERDGAFEVVATSGTQQGESACVPLLYQGETLGRLLVGGDVEDRALLEGFASQAGAAVHGVRLTVQLQRAREQLVLTREEERRRLRHDLHDELAPTLAGLSLTAATASDLLETDPWAARVLVTELHAALRSSVGEVRRLAHDLRPPVLDELGLLAALRERARQFDTASGEDDLRVSVRAPDALPPLPAAVEVAAYRICSEALLNVVRHAQARTCTIHLAICEAEAVRRLHIEVSDDGVGVPAVYRSGIGLHSMHERAAELGGTCSVGPAPGGGTRVLVELPLT